MNIAQVDSLERVQELPCVPLERREELPATTGVYFAATSDELLYIGKSINIKGRWKSHCRLKQLEQIEGVSVHWLKLRQDKIDETEKFFIKSLCPSLNGKPIPITRKPEPEGPRFIPTLQLKLNQAGLGSRLLCSNPIMIQKSWVKLTGSIIEAAILCELDERCYIAAHTQGSDDVLWVAVQQLMRDWFAHPDAETAARDAIRRLIGQRLIEKATGKDGEYIRLAFTEVA